VPDPVAQAAADAELKEFVYSVLCERKERCRMRFELSGEVVEMPLLRSLPFRRRVEASLLRVKKQGYPASRDKEYKVLDGMRPVDCWISDDPGQAGSLCRLKTGGGRVQWVILWGDMCSASCYSGFIPFFAMPKK
jgi:hypothetical protein